MNSISQASVRTIYCFHQLPSQSKNETRTYRVGGQTIWNHMAATASHPQRPIGRCGRLVHLNSGLLRHRVEPWLLRPQLPIIRRLAQNSLKHLQQWNYYKITMFLPFQRTYIKPNREVVLTRVLQAHRNKSRQFEWVTSYNYHLFKLHRNYTIKREYGQLEQK